MLNEITNCKDIISQQTKLKWNFAGQCFQADIWLSNQLMYFFVLTIFLTVSRQVEMNLIECIWAPACLPFYKHITKGYF